MSSTLWRQREEYCARVIQNAYRKYIEKGGGFTGGEAAAAPAATAPEENAEPATEEQEEMKEEVAILIEDETKPEESGQEVVSQSKAPSTESVKPEEP